MLMDGIKTEADEGRMHNEDDRKDISYLRYVQQTVIRHFAENIISLSLGKLAKLCQEVSPNSSTGGLTGTTICCLHQHSATVSLHAHRRAR